MIEITVIFLIGLALVGVWVIEGEIEKRKDGSFSWCDMMSLDVII